MEDAAQWWGRVQCAGQLLDHRRQVRSRRQQGDHFAERQQLGCHRLGHAALIR